MKTCTCCKQFKPLCDFSPRKNSKFGRHAQCRLCINEKNRLYRLSIPKQRRIYTQRYRGKYREKLLKKDYDRYWSEPERWRQQKKDWYASLSEEERKCLLEKDRIRYREDPDYRNSSILRNRQWHATHRKQSRTLAKKWALNHPEKVRNRRIQRRARIAGATVIESIDRQAIIARDNSTCHICKKKVKGKDLTLDHLVPLARGGHHMTINLAVAHRMCNSSHGAGRFPVQLRLLG